MCALSFQVLKDDFHPNIVYTFANMWFMVKSVAQRLSYDEFGRGIGSWQLSPRDKNLSKGSFNSWFHVIEWLLANIVA